MHQRNLYSSYPPEYGGGGSGYSNYPPSIPQQQQQHYGNDYHQQQQQISAQHNHPPYYSQQQQHHQSYNDPIQQQQYDHSYQNGYPPGGSSNRPTTYDYTSNNNPQPYLSSSSSSAYPDRSYHQQQQQPPAVLQPQTQPLPVAIAQPQPPPPIKPSYPPPNLNLKPTTTAKNPYGQTGPYGIDAANPYADYYRKLYYPYDPITGEYMKDATPPGDTGSTNLLPNVMPDSMANQMFSRSYAAQSSSSAGRYGGMGGGGGGGYGNDPTSMMMMNNYYGGGYGGDQENDSLLLCCDFLIPRPNIKCLLITLFILLVLIILIAVIRFLVSLSGDQSEELATLLEQTCMLLLIAALGDLLWIIGVYFTSRRTRHQIATILSCATNPSSSSAIETTLSTNDFNNYLYDQQQQHRRSYVPNVGCNSSVVNYNRYNSGGGGPSNYV